MSQKRIQISAFKAQCIAVLREVDSRGHSVVVTMRGRPVAIVEPVPRSRTLGALKGECEIRTDLVGADFAEEWEMNR